MNYKLNGKVQHKNWAQSYFGDRKSQYMIIGSYMMAIAYRSLENNSDEKSVNINFKEQAYVGVYKFESYLFKSCGVYNSDHKEF